MTEETTVPAVVATQRIDGTILPGTLFVPADAQQHADLVALDAVREPTEAELLLHEKMESNRAAAAAAAAAAKKPAGRGKTAAQTETPAPTGGEAGGEGGDDAANAIG